MNYRNLLVNLGLAFANLGAKYDPSGIAQKVLDAYAKRPGMEAGRPENKPEAANGEPATETPEPPKKPLMGRGGRPPRRIRKAL